MPGRVRVRWIIFALVTGFACFGYAQRTGVTVISAHLVSDAILSQVQVGWALTAFLTSYTALQLAGGVFGEYLGARWTFIVITALAIASTLVIAGASLVASGIGLFSVFLIGCSLLGVAQAPIFPVLSGAIESWFPVGRWGTPQGLMTAGVQIASAFAAPSTAWLVEAVGWRPALIVPSGVGVALTAIWFWLGRDSPAEHPFISRDELNELRSGRPVIKQGRVSARDVLRVLSDRNILLLSTAYMCMNFVFYFLSFWCVLYLVQQRHFSILESGFLAAIPYAGAAFGGTLGGLACDHLTARFGLRIGFRAIPLVALPAAAILLFLAVSASNAYWAVAALAFAFASIELTEGPFLAGATTVAREHTMAATGVVNTGGNLGGIIATPLIATLTAHHGWTSAFLTVAAFSVLSALLWLGIDASKPLRSSPLRSVDIRPVQRA